MLFELKKPTREKENIPFRKGRLTFIIRYLYI